MLQVSRPDRGVLFVVSGPSGVGKSTLLRRAIEQVPGVGFSVSATTREPRTQEVDGVHYHFVDDARFLEWIEADHFVEHASVYGKRYGTLRKPTEAAMSAGESLILDIDVVGAANVRRELPEAVHLMILPPSLEVLERRLRSRGTDSEQVILGRMAKVQEQVGALGSFDYLVMNDDLEAATSVFRGIVLAEMSRRDRRAGWVQRFAHEVTSE